jgi:hypothetical protein
MQVTSKVWAQFNVCFAASAVTLLAACNASNREVTSNADEELSKLKKINSELTHELQKKEEMIKLFIKYPDKAEFDYIVGLTNEVKADELIQMVNAFCSRNSQSPLLSNALALKAKLQSEIDLRLNVEKQNLEYQNTDKIELLEVCRYPEALIGQKKRISGKLTWNFKQHHPQGRLFDLSNARQNNMIQVLAGTRSMELFLVDLLRWEQRGVYCEMMVQITRGDDLKMTYLILECKQLPGNPSN